MGPRVSVADVLIISGPAAAGKTTLARKWAQSRDFPCVHISLDDVRDWVRSGYANPERGWNTAAEEQYFLARRCVATCVREYQKAGYYCVIDDAVFPDWPAVSFEGWQRELPGMDMRLVVLMPSLEVLLERNEFRVGTRRLSERMLETIHSMMIGWQHRDVAVIDNTHLSVEEALAALNATVGRGDTSGPAPVDA